MKRTVVQVGCEVLSSVRAKWLLSSIISLIAALSLACTIIATARSATLTEAVLAELDTIETRTIAVQATPSDHLSPRTLGVLEGVTGIDVAVAEGVATDVTNQALPGGAAIPSRRIWVDDRQRCGLPVAVADTANALAYATPTALARLGIDALPAAVGNTSGFRLAVVGELDESAAASCGLSGLVVPTSSREVGDVTTMIVVTRSADDVAAIARTVRSALPTASSSSVRVRTSEAIARLSGSIGVELQSFNTSLIFAAVVGSGVLVATVQSGLVMSQRKDFGRRRALGATRLMIIALIAGHTMVTTAIGAIVGASGSILGLSRWDLVVPPPDVVLAFAGAVVTSAVCFAVIPGAVAAHFDPAAEMRSP